MNNKKSVKAFKKTVVKFFWCNLHHRLEKYFKERFKEQLRIFLERNKYRPHNISQIRFFRCAAAFDNLCNRIGSQYNLQLPNGVPTHVFPFLVQYRATQEYSKVTNKLMQEIPTQSGLNITNGSTAAYNFMN